MRRALIALAMSSGLVGPAMAAPITVWLQDDAPDDKAVDKADLQTGGTTHLWNVDLRYPPAPATDADAQAVGVLDSVVEAGLDRWDGFEVELGIVADIQAAVDGIDLLRGDIEREDLVDALIFQGTALTRYYGVDGLAADADATGRFEHEGAVLPRPWVDAYAIAGTGPTKGSLLDAVANENYRHVADAIAGLPKATLALPEGVGEVSMALASIRRQIAIDNRRLHSPEWATPVLYSRVGDTARFAGISARGIADARAGAGANQFIGREWLWGKVSERLETPDKTVTLLVADGGMGKSSFVEFCRRRVETSVEAADEADASAPLLLDYRYHYGERADGLSCAQSLSRQLRRWLQDNGRAVPNEPPPDAHGSPFARACKVLNRLVLEVATHTKTILFIDALDEATDPAEALPIAAILDDLPDNLAVFATTRPEWYAKWRAGNDVEAVDDEAGHDKRFSVITLEPLSTPNLQDIALFLQNTFAPYRIGMSATECLSLANDVGGSFLVADILCGMLRTGDDKTLVQDRFKQANSVTGAYDLVFRTLAADLANDPEAERRLRDTEDLLALISCSQDALSEEQLRYLFDARDGAESVDASDALAVAMSHLRRFLSSDLTASGEALFRPYHQSLRAYGERRLGVKALSSAPDSKPQQPNTNTVPPRGLEQGAKRPLPRSPQEYRQLWADYCLRWPELEQYPRTYALRHLVPHLLMLDDDQAALEIERVLTDYAYIAAALGADPSKPDRPLDVNELISRYESVESKVAR